MLPISYIMLYTTTYLNMISVGGMFSVSYSHSLCLILLANYTINDQCVVIWLLV
jgi:hypothetical protein